MLSKTKIIFITGGSGSGKSYLAKKIAETLKDRCTVICEDSYYKPLSHLTIEERATVNFDHPDYKDFKMLLKHLTQLKDGNFAEIPEYDFTVHDRKKKPILIQPSEFVVVDGILLMCIPELISISNLSVFVDTPADIRFIRRLKRDTKKRARTMESVINKYLTTMQPMHYQFIEPSKKQCNMIYSGTDDSIDEFESIIAAILEL